MDFGDEEYAGAEGPRKQASVTERAVVSMRAAHIGDQKMQI